MPSLCAKTRYNFTGTAVLPMLYSRLRRIYPQITQITQIIKPLCVSASLR